MRYFTLKDYSNVTYNGLTKETSRRFFVFLNIAIISQQKGN